MGSGASKPEWYPGEPTTDVLNDECSCDPAAGLGSGGDGATTATSLSRKGSGSFSMSIAREITRLPVVELTDMEVRLIYTTIKYRVLFNTINTRII